jgi:hypothetical protein
VQQAQANLTLAKAKYERRSNAGQGFVSARRGTRRRTT